MAHLDQWGRPTDAPRFLRGAGTARAAIVSLIAVAALGVVLVPDVTAARNRSQIADSLIVLSAGSLAAPLRAALDSFVAREHSAGRTLAVRLASGGSIEMARRASERGDTPDVIALADYANIPQFLMPEHATWYAQFARNAMAVVYTTRSRFAGEITTANWWRVLSRPGVRVAQANQSLDPGG